MLIMQCVVYNVKPVEPHAALVPVPVAVVKLTYWSGQYLVVECCEYTINISIWCVVIIKIEQHAVYFDVCILACCSGTLTH